ncbi:MAG TPA: dTDP-4-dehydrorhamnose 3,5-epimerase [Fibrobacteraceae bacterium]|nr:dTDP-4-dehydrorhamnose 3,5-epimerase [Fibrobacteraceae bacterium]
MKSEITPIAGLQVLYPDVFKDDRGWFYESYNIEKFEALGIHETFVQDNHSRSVQNTLRGLHYQSSPGQAKLIRCTRGRIWDVALDIRPDSPSFGKWYGLELDDQACAMFFMPVGFAHGFCVLSDYAEVQYKCSSVYNGATESGIAWDDPDIAVAWPVKTPVLSKRDIGNTSFVRFSKSVKS